MPPTTWTEFRGPARDGVQNGVTIPTDWSANPPRLKWRRRVGPAWSSMIVIADRLFTQEQRDEMEAVVCYEAATGREIWIHTDKARFEESVSGAGPRGTPTFAQARIFTLGATGILNCLDAGSGEKAWSHTITTDAESKPPMWDFLLRRSLPRTWFSFMAAAMRARACWPIASLRVSWPGPPTRGALSYSSPQVETIGGKKANPDRERQRSCFVRSGIGKAALELR